MTRLFDDEQTTSLIRAMANPESNARKMAEQNQEIGVPSDITNDILNKYATYGANTGIGNLGGSRLVEAINEQYRKKVDAPLQQQQTTKAQAGMATSTAIPYDLSMFDLEQLKAAAKAADAPSNVIESPSTEAPSLEAYNSPVTLPEEQPAVAAPDLENMEVGTKLERLKKYLEENPLVAKQLGETAGTVGGILAKEAIGEDETERVVSAPRPRFQPSRVSAPRIGMSGGGKPPEGSVLGRKLFLEGGEVDGPGGPKEDLVPIWASDKEYVMSHEAVKRVGDGDFDKGIAALDKINFGK